MSLYNDYLKIKIPENIIEEKEKSTPKTNKKNQKAINQFKQAIKNQYDELTYFINEEIDENNKIQIEKLIFATEDLINNCIVDTDYEINKDQNFVSLMYLYQRILLKKETYKMDKEIKQLEQRNKELKDYQTQIEEKNNNLVYNLLGFLTSFSIVSASVAAIVQIEDTMNIVLFMTFIVLILLTTLIALHNFYKNNNKRETRLQDNYFLWKVVSGIVITLGLILGIRAIFNSENNFIFRYIDEKIETVTEKKVNQELEKQIVNT